MNKPLLRDKIEDLVKRCEHRGNPLFTGFLDEYEVVSALNILNELKFTNFNLWGGYKGANRAMLGLFPIALKPDNICYPLTSLYFSFLISNSLNHKDFLGALMSLGISRKCVGDISLEENLAIVYVSDKVSKFVKLELNRVKKQNVVLTDDFKGRIPKPQEFLNIRSTVSSKRLDCIVSAITNFSRAKSAKLINEKKVRVNGEYIDSVSAKINENDKIVIHGFGKLIVDGLSLETRKKKIALLARKYK